MPANVLSGGAGNDLVYGNGGDDILIGGAARTISLAARVRTRSYSTLPTPRVPTRSTISQPRIMIISGSMLATMG